jgi:pimeloyl-ACP methyl ester carboxylesterase
MPVLKVQQAEINYIEVGAGEPVLLLHGLGSSVLDWEPQITALSGRYRVIAVDARGSGESRDLARLSGPFRVEQFAKDAVAVLEHLKATPAHVIGLSMGGAIALEMAATRPDLVKTLTVINSAPSFQVKGAAAWATIWLRRVIARLYGPQGMAKMLAPKLFPAPDQQALRERFIQRMGRNKRGAYIASQLAVLGWSVLDKFPRMTMPTLVLGAEHDYPFLQNKQAWVSKLPNAHYVEIPGAHHAMPIEVPDAVNDALRTFLAAHTSTPS